MLTIICMLERKGHLAQRGEGKAHVYKAKAKEAADANIRRSFHFSSEFWMKTH